MWPLQIVTWHSLVYAPYMPCLQIPYFNAPIYLENKTQIGKVEEILGSINNVVSSHISPLYYYDTV